MLPNNLQYMNKVESAPARQYTSTVQPLNGTGDYKPNSKCIINIPTSPNTVLVPSESYLRFKLGGITNGGALNASIRLDKCGAHGIFQRCRVTHGSTLIEDIDNYGNLVGLMMALQQTTDSFGGKMNILAGTTSSMGLNSGEAICQTVGERLGANVAIDAVVPDRVYGINLMSYLGSLGGSQYIPLFEMTSAPLTLELQLVDSALKFLCSRAALNVALQNPANYFKISDVEFVGTFIELSDESINIIRASQGGQPLQYVIQQYANVPGNDTLPTGAPKSISLPVSAKYASLKSLFCTIRANSGGAVSQYPYSSEHFNLQNWRVRIGSQILPAKQPNSIPEHYAELLKAIGSLSDINHEPSINMLNYNVAIPVPSTEAAVGITTTSKSNCFALGFDCETYSGSNKDKIFAGMNTLNSDIFWLMDFNGNGAGADVNAKFDFYALYDQVIMFENGVTRIVK